MKPERIEALRGDITLLEVDAIVNAANETLLGGGGVDGAIHRAAGPELRLECMKLGGCATGKAKLTKGYRLKARFVIHTVGPVWYGGVRQEALDLEDCYANSLKLAVENGVRSLAFPCISTGAFGFPAGQAAEIAVRTVSGFLAKEPRMEKILFVCFLQSDFDRYLGLLAS
jgi:O-acetyl-ADP-ribose deacetylase